MIYPYVIYVSASILVGVVGRNSRLGFWGVTLLSMAISPVISIFLVLFLSDRARSFFTFSKRLKSWRSSTKTSEASPANSTNPSI
jgi:uncharacterized membrane protein YhaH (DUF805 family)